MQKYATVAFGKMCVVAEGELQIMRVGDVDITLPNKSMLTLQ